MKMFALIAATLVASATMVPTVADAASGQTTVTRTTVTRSTASRSDRHDRRWHAQRWHWKTRCTTRWHHHRKVRTCRKVRVRW